jgi:butyrate kinase
MSKPNFKILAVNPGSTSTKVALFEDGAEKTSAVFSHTNEELSRFQGVWGQLDLRLGLVKKWVQGQTKTLDAVAAMGGLLRPVAGGTYEVSDLMLNDARANLQGEHASNLGCALAHEISGVYHCQAFVVDPVSVDEFDPPARLSGHPLIERRTLSHALNIHAAARKGADEIRVPVEETSFVVAHLGGGISIAAVRGGRIIDVNDASSDGPFSPERTGGLPLQQFITLVFSKKYDEEQLRKLVMGRGGLVAYLGTNSAREIEERIKREDRLAHGVYRAMAYQISKEIGAMAAVLKGRVNAVILTGGVAASSLLVDWISEHVRAIAPLILYPGEFEMQSLALGALRVLRGDETAKEY